MAGRRKAAPRAPSKTDFYILQWPGAVGGADTRARDLIRLLLDCGGFNVKVLPNDLGWLKSDKATADWLASIGVPVLQRSAQLATSMAHRGGVAFACCNFDLFKDDARLLRFVKDAALPFVWANDMMWHSDEELAAIKAGLVNCVLYTSDFHAMRMAVPVRMAKPDALEALVDNYFWPDNHKFMNRPISRGHCVIGKHSRDDWAKYSENFPDFYERLGLADPRYSVMGWGDNQTAKWRWHQFDKSRWTTLPLNAMPVYDFLATLDVYVYNSHHKFVENQSRAIVEAAMSGLPIVAPNKYNFPNQIWHERTGYLWDNYGQCQTYCRRLEADPELRAEMGARASKLAFDIWCDRDRQLRQWSDVLEAL